MASVAYNETTSLPPLLRIPSDLVRLLLAEIATPPFNYSPLARLSAACSRLRQWVLSYAPQEYLMLHSLSRQARLLSPLAPNLDAQARLAQLKDSYFEILHEIYHIQKTERLNCYDDPLDLNAERLQCGALLNATARYLPQDGRGDPRIRIKGVCLNAADGHQHMFKLRMEIIRFDSRRCDKIKQWLYFATSDPHTAQKCDIEPDHWYEVNSNATFLSNIRNLLCKLAAEISPSAKPLPPIWPSCSLTMWWQAMTGIDEYDKAPGPPVNGPPRIYAPAIFPPIPPINLAAQLRRLIVAHMLATTAREAEPGGSDCFSAGYMGRLYTKLRGDIEALREQVGETGQWQINTKP
ncbi:hypothetical protein HDU88_002538 [Geranomyces variabilis]|nr:hypothetical protein HDU88_002538 [Geranomyces variabilis]